MTSTEALKDMIMSFRVVELQSLLEFAGDRNLKLRKKELQKKAIKLISKRKAMINNKIRTIYANMMSDNRGDFSDSYNNFDSWMNDFVYSDNDRLPNLPYDHYFDDYNSLNVSNNCYDNASNSSSENNLFLSMFKHIDIQRVNEIKFKNLSFFEYVSDITLVQPLIPKRHDGNVFDFNLTFALNSEIKNNLFRDDEVQSRYQTLLRICRLNDEIEVHDTLPPKLTVSVNNTFCSLPAPPPTNKAQNVSSKRIDAPINITEYLEKIAVNKLFITWSGKSDTLYGFVIQLVRKYDSEELIKRLKEKGEQDPAISKKIIFNNLNDQDVEIAATSLKMSLTCPLGKMLMSLPARGSTCNHLQCFDGCFYIKMNEIRSTWQCPVCNQTCLYEDLFIDGYFMDILRSDKFTPNVTDIQLSADGSWESVIQDRCKQSARISPKNPNKRPKIVEGECNKKKEKAPEPNSGLPPMLNESIVDDLKRFFFQYDNPDMSDISTHKSSYSSFSKCDDVSLDNFFNIKPMNDTDLSTLSSNSTHDSITKKNIILVDLTESDSESDEIRSISSFSDDSNNSSLLCLRNDLSHVSNPPIYDIDSDSS